MRNIIITIVTLVLIGVAFVYQSIVLNDISYKEVDLTGKIAIVTGGSSGIGIETVRKLVQWNCTVFMPVRNIAKAELVKSDILASSSSSVGSIELMEMDLSSFESVRKFAKEFLSKNIHVDILILNAVHLLILIYNILHCY
jgi:NAD(P)-dependent dehydrogenase (short-subunit alcohol dehydrogenase family)